MKPMLKAIIPSFIIIFLGITAGHSCTTFFIHHQGKSVFGKNYDWFLGRGIIIINKKGVFKKAMPDAEAQGPYAEWASKYGSLTFNQYGREFPMGGMNEAGLVIHLMMLTETTFPPPDERPVIKELQWIQYHLDKFATVDQVVENQSNIRIVHKEEPGIHYLVADKNGNCATIEFIGGNLVVHSKDTLPVKALANDRYSASLSYLKTHQGFGGSIPIIKGESSMKRFVFASKMLRDFHLKPKKSMVDYAFKILYSVKQSTSTQWSIVYDLNALTVYFHTRKCPGMKSVNLTAFDLKCSTPVEVLDMNSDSTGNILHLFYDYSKETNYRLIRDAFDGTWFLRNTPAVVMDRRATYPDSHICRQ
ncbi:MAG: linear amide C-N hydrolase [Thermodesulfobacteriota bacterium]|nr:linear amide C-N hydrolase [Thermodesulfobacteriota bacterium]